MRIVFVTTEVVPFAKTGGLADVCGALPIRLAARGHQCSVIMPAFSQIHDAGQEIESTDFSFAIHLRDQIVGGRILRSYLPDSQVPVYFVDQPQYFSRPQLYGDLNGDYEDNCERFCFFCRAVLQTISRLQLDPDIVHCNDWQSGLVPAYVRSEFESHGWMPRTSTVMTVHNLAYQGQFPHWDMGLTGLDWAYFNPAGMEFYGKLNLLKTGLVFCDAISTVSPQYAKEIQTSEHGCGLEGVLANRNRDLFGIINGVDYQHWDPSSDPYLTSTFNLENWVEGKAANRSSIRHEFGLADDPNIPLIGMVGRLADQKGWDLIIEAMTRLMAEDRPLHWAVLGTGQPRYHQALEALSAQHPGRIALKLGFSNALAHRIEAASDMFLMPSQYEPCGLNQLYSLRYAAVPIVNPTGGLADTVVDTTAETLAAGTATGFYLKAYTAESLVDSIWRAALVRWDDWHTWKRIVETGMRQDWSWRRSAAQYEHLYSETRLKKSARQQAPPKRRPRR